MPHIQPTVPAPLRTDNPQVACLPNHLRQFAVDQRFDDYTPIDHAVWRYIMKQAVHILKEHAHRVYFTGLLNTGINLEAIPRIEDMNDILGKIGWGAVAVDGFIPPAAFMEFQAYKVLVIACDMRQINHIEYTPAPDIVHEAAGHAPIIVDGEYADYLNRFGQVGTRAMSSKKDFELYEAIRRLSILKEAPDTDPIEVERALKEVLDRQANLGEPSEMARLSRLHWWTVEYGLIGTMETPKIYGAGLLSSIGEAVSCLEENVKKIPYDLNAATYAFDITTKQPQLFVTPDFKHLNNVLDQFVATMAYTVGGSEGLTKAIECGNVCSCAFSSGLQLTGPFSELIAGRDGQPIYLRTTGPSAIAYDHKQVEGHGKEYHADGFGSPVGRLTGVPQPLETMSDSQLRDQKIETGKDVTLSFEGGIKVTGHLERIERRNGKIILMIFTACKVTHGGRVLFKPEWGTYDMAVGEKIVSVFSGAADKDAYDQVPLVSRQRTIKVTHDEAARKLHALYQQIRDIRDHKRPYDELNGLWSDLKANHPHDWLASMEILEILFKKSLFSELRLEIKQSLDAKAASRPELAKLITDGLLLIV